MTLNTMVVLGTSRKTSCGRVFTVLPPRGRCILGMLSAVVHVLREIRPTSFGLLAGCAQSRKDSELLRSARPMRTVELAVSRTCAAAI
jgi:hypothetical protein